VLATMNREVSRGHSSYGNEPPCTWPVRMVVRAALPVGDADGAVDSIRLRVYCSLNNVKDR
jgi:hypothetical protein